MLPIAVTEKDVFVVLRSYLLAVVDTDVEVIRGQDNRVPEPFGRDFITMIPILRTSRFRNLTDYYDSLFTGQIAGHTLSVTDVALGEIKVGLTVYGTNVLPGTTILSQTDAVTFTVDKEQTVPLSSMAGGSKDVFTPTELIVQLDLHGPRSADLCQKIVTTFRDVYTAEQFALHELPVFPLFASEPKQLAFANSEQQVEGRWVLDLAIQYNATVTLPQQFFDDTTITATEVGTI